MTEVPILVNFLDITNVVTIYFADKEIVVSVGKGVSRLSTASFYCRESSQ